MSLSEIHCLVDKIEQLKKHIVELEERLDAVRQCVEEFEEADADGSGLTGDWVVDKLQAALGGDDVN